MPCERYLGDLLHVFKYPKGAMMINRYRLLTKYKSLAKHYEKLYLETNHELVQLKKQAKSSSPEVWFPAGHFYSPYPDLKEISRRKAKVFDRSKRAIPGIDINEAGQLALLKDLAKYYRGLPYQSRRKHTDLRYFFENDAYSYTDAIILFTILRKYQPKQVIEIGSGYSSALMMDVNENFLNNKMSLTFIEPYPKLLQSLMKKGDKRYTIIGKNLSEVDSSLFKKLGKNDILFIDSTHVSKVGSDVNQIFFEILPLLKKGVIIHIHDIFYPFEYPYEWIKQTRAWTEDYIVRAFLHNNKEYKVLVFNHFLNEHHADKLDKLMPLMRKNSGGSLWIQKV